MDLHQKLIDGDVLSIARLITRLENRDEGAIGVVKELYGNCGHAQIIGITGPPGAGKSCLTAALIQEFRNRGKTVGVLAVDPSSPFTGGSFLGDRARMDQFSSDENVFIRSFASRGAVGGLAVAVNDAADVLDVSGKDVILIETVGVGQGEIDIAGIAHTVILTLVPGYGDMLQTLKAGIMEVADIIVVNKADQPGADKAVNSLSTMPAVSYGDLKMPCAVLKHNSWSVPIVKTSALKGSGINELAEIIASHDAHIRRTNLLAEINQKRRKKQFLDIMVQQVREQFLAELNKDPALQGWMDKIGNLDLDPYSASDKVISMIKRAREKEKPNKGGSE